MSARNHEFQMYGGNHPQSDQTGVYFSVHPYLHVLAVRKSDSGWNAQRVVGNALCVHKILEVNSLPGRCSPPNIIYRHVGPRRLPSESTTTATKQFGNSCVRIGYCNGFTTFSTNILSRHSGHPMQTCPRLPPITPDYTRLHPTFDSDYPIARAHPNRA